LAKAFAERGPLVHFKKLDLSDNDCGDASMCRLGLGLALIP
jgi:hypothetical protein